MSTIFGEVRQNGYVVRDIEAAMKHWTATLGVGPFFYIEKVPVEDFRYRGEPSDAEFSVALANTGSLQIELIQQRNDAPSMYRDFLEAGREGLHHLAYWTRDFDKAMKELEPKGYAVGQSGQISGPTGRFVYFDTETHPGRSSNFRKSADPRASSSKSSPKRPAVGTARIPFGRPDKRERFGRGGGTLTTAATTDFKLGDLANAEDPYGLLASVRSQGNVLRSANSWIVLGHKEAIEVLSSPNARSGFIGELYKNMLPPGAAREEMSHRINFLDPPAHSRIRKLIAKAFTRRRIETLRPYVGDLSRRLLKRLEGEAEIDLISGFAHQVPSFVISELLGVPIEDRDRLTGYTDRVAALLGLGSLTSETMQDAVAAAEELHAYLRVILEERRRESGDDLLSALLAVEDEERMLTENELMSLAATLYSTGHRTTRDLFSNGLSVLLANRELVKDVVDKKIDVEAVIEEFLRFETPTHYVARMFCKPTEIGGVKIGANEPVAVVIASANRDGSVYSDADTFDPYRWREDPVPPQPMSFAPGPHFCLGANLARLEAQVMLGTLLETYPNVELTGAPLTFWHTGLFRGLKALPVRLGPRSGP